MTSILKQTISRIEPPKSISDRTSQKHLRCPNCLAANVLTWRRRKREHKLYDNWQLNIVNMDDYSLLWSRDDIPAALELLNSPLCNHAYTLPPPSPPHLVNAMFSWETNVTFHNPVLRAKPSLFHVYGRHPSLSTSSEGYWMMFRLLTRVRLFHGLGGFASALDSAGNKRPGATPKVFSFSPVDETSHGCKQLR